MANPRALGQNLHLVDKSTGKLLLGQKKIKTKYCADVKTSQKPKVFTRKKFFCFTKNHPTMEEDTKMKIQNILDIVSKTDKKLDDLTVKVDKLEVREKEISVDIAKLQDENSWL